ncbi:MAG: YlxR family protein [Actinomycetota bacterium]
MSGREPERSCIGCRRRRPKAELLRLARAPDGAVNVDRSGKAPGRGAYLCRDDPSCLRLATTKGALGRALRVPLGPGDLATLEASVKEEIEAP